MQTSEIKKIYISEIVSVHVTHNVFDIVVFN